MNAFNDDEFAAMLDSVPDSIDDESYILSDSERAFIAGFWLGMCNGVSGDIFTERHGQLRDAFEGFSVDEDGFISIDLDDYDANADGGE